MTDSLYETIRSIVRSELGAFRGADLGVVEEIHPHASDSDPDNYACTVRLRDSGLVLKSVPLTTERVGSVGIPHPGELVLVQFLRGDVNAPVVVGRLYNEEDRPPVSEEGQWVTHLPLGAGDSDATRIELFHGDRRELAIHLGDGLSVVMKDDDPVLEITVDGGQGALSIERDGTINLKGNGTLTLEGSGDVTLKAGGTLTLQGAKVDINP